MGLARFDWTVFYFSMDTAKHLFRAVMQASLQCVASQQHNIISLVFIYRVGLEMELLFSISSSLLNMICLCIKLLDGKDKGF